MVTVDWPRQALYHEGPPNGVPSFDPGPCTACGDCVEACPCRCLTIGEGDSTPTVDAGVCVRCGHCVDACGEGAVELTGDGVMAMYSREDLVMDGGPPGEVDMGPPPSRLYRMTADPGGRESLEPLTLLEARYSELLRRERPPGKG